MQVRLLSASNLDLERHVELLRSAFGRTPWATQIGDSLTPDFYRWKYFPPAGEALIASLSDENGLVSSVSAFPALLQTSGGAERAWQIGDIATVPLARRRGFYRKCLDALIEHLGESILYCFPNEFSRRGMQASGFGFAAELRTFVRPLIRFAGSGERCEERLELPEKTDVSVPGEVGLYSFVRDRAFLDWRYCDNPSCRYEIISSPDGYCIFRPFIAFGRRVNVVMEIAASNPRSLWDVIKKVENTAAGEGRVANFIMTSVSMPWRMRVRYLPIPHRLLPKRQVFLVRMPRGRRLDGRWDVQIGDWDGL